MRRIPASLVLAIVLISVTGSLAQQEVAGYRGPQPGTLPIMTLWADQLPPDRKSVV